VTEGAAGRLSPESSGRPRDLPGKLRDNKRDQAFECWEVAK
jgi:hypothetical protein